MMSHKEQELIIQLAKSKVVKNNKYLSKKQTQLNQILIDENITLEAIIDYLEVE
jgi:hypothetical protein